MDFTIFFQELQKQLQFINLKTKRYLYHSINWENRLIFLLGQRGVGKTTLILQHIKQNYKNSSKVLYISVDNPYFKTISLYEFATMFESYGGEILFIDEVHKYKEFSSHIKSIYDSTKLKLVVSGSSMLQISSKEADLSRRAITYHLANLSFREYLNFTQKLDLPSFSLDDVLHNHIELSNDIISQIKPLEFFKIYLQNGCYPFILNNNDSYTHLLVGVINQIIEIDMPYIANINFNQIDKIKKLIYLLSTSVPLKPNISKLSANSSISRPTLLEYLALLEKANLTISINQKARGYGVLSKPDKLFMNNTNLIYAVSQNNEIGTLRETFFVNQIKSTYINEAKLIDDDILLSDSGDFLLKNRYTVEIGGKSKSFKQIKNLKDSFVVADDIEVGFGNKIPLWLFGFLY